MKTKANKRVVANLQMPRKMADYIMYVKGIIKAVDGNVFFANPDPSLLTITTNINALDKAESVALNRARGSTGTRDVQKALVDKDLFGLQAYVQRIADADPANAIAIIESAGMSVQKSTARSKGGFEVRHGRESGSVTLLAKAVDTRASYEWQISSDNINWKALPVTIKASTLVTGLTPGERHYFRVRVNTKNGEGSWSHALSILVI
jgi:hypothetical protein